MTAPGATAPDPRLGQVSIRRATVGDHEALVKLAQLDGAPPPDGDRYLLAEEDGALRAARPLAGGRVIADPFHPTADLVAMLELRASRLMPRDGAGRPPRGLRSPLARRLRDRAGLRRAPASRAASVGFSGSAAGRT